MPCGTHNVWGAWDSIGDVVSDLLGTLVYAGVGVAFGGIKTEVTLAPSFEKRRPEGSGTQISGSRSSLTRE